MGRVESFPNAPVLDKPGVIGQAQAYRAVI